MSERWEDATAALASGLLQECGVVEDPAPQARARFALRLTGNVEATAVLEDTWLRIERALGQLSPVQSASGQRPLLQLTFREPVSGQIALPEQQVTERELARLIAWNVRLPGGAKLALVRARGANTSGGALAVRGGLGLQARAEVALDGDGEPVRRVAAGDGLGAEGTLARRVRDACQGVTCAAYVASALAPDESVGAGSPTALRAEADAPSSSLLPAGGPSRAPAGEEGEVGELGEQAAKGVVGANAIDPQRADELEKHCEEAGWSVTRRPDGRLVVDLDVPGGFFQASLAPLSDGQACASTDLVALTQPAAPECETALWILLLRIAGVVRMVRAASRAEASGCAAGFDVVFATTPTPAELNHALSSLSIACRVGGREAVALASDPVLAREYLSRGPWRPGAGPEAIGAA